MVLDFAVDDHFSSHHYAFKVSDQQFDEILERVKTNKLGFGSGPYSVDDGKINHDHGGRGVYFEDPNGHILEIITQDYIID